VDVLGSVWKTGIPLEVVDIAYRPIQKKIATQLGGQTRLRMAEKKMVHLQSRLLFLRLSER